MNRDLALADWLEELAVYGHPRKFQHAEIAFHVAEVIRHRYVLRLAFAHSPIELRTLGMPAPTRVQPNATATAKAASPYLYPRPRRTGAPNGGK